MSISNVPRTWHQCGNEEILKIYKEVINEAERLGYNTKSPALFMYKSTCRWGTCRTVRGTSYIGLNEVFLNDPEKSRDTLIHELAHSLVPKDGHGSKWHSIGDNIGKKWSIEMSRCSSDEEIGLEMPKKETDKYTIECPKCKMQWHYMRMTKVVKAPETYRCGRCNQKLVRVK